MTEALPRKTMRFSGRYVEPRSPDAPTCLQNETTIPELEALGDEGEKAVKRVLGRSDGSVTAIYNRYGQVREIRGALEQWANDLTGILAMVGNERPEPVARVA